ncbi:MAG: ABC transporter substrate-binding protein [Anaerolineaceae bacterium]|nr:ABC transporter substrate-binding protein [Anaerolineaceae bacterium]
MKKSITILTVLTLLMLAACQIVAPSPTAEPSPTSIPPTEVPAATAQPTLAATAAAPSAAPTEAPVSAEKVEVKYAQNFSLEYKEGYKLLTVKTAESPKLAQYALVEKGSKPQISEEGAIVIETPIEKIITLSSTYYPALEQIGKLESIAAIDDATYTYNEKIRAGVEAGKIATIGDGFVSKINIEKIIELDPDLVMVPYMSASNLDEAKMKEAKITTVLNADYLENSPLGRAEWTKFIAAFYNLEAEAAKAFEQTVARYEEAKGLAAKVEKPVTVFVNTAYQGTWYMPGKESYLAELFKDAGALYIFADTVEGTGSSPLAFEVVYEKAKDADYWLNTGFAPDLKGLIAEDARYAEFKALKENHVFNNNARMNANGGTDYYESGVVNPDVVLKDLIKIFYSQFLPDYELFYYQQVK